ncbi:hypothetical protein HPP92_007116 [Vanilla planifolia]|uniref:Bromo domain-containing protein n=1 Tax=Vanilla planifolia TaxID=51239 RepID=A0A835V938_VANPL|nr:hypothetical protein HPP92_007116 [Vanilla planifolia]
MGKVVEKKRKKKGRPSLLDLQKRSLRLQKQQEEEQQQKRNPNPNPSSNPYARFPNPPAGRRPTRRNPVPDPETASLEEDGGGTAATNSAVDDDDEDEPAERRKEKKLKLVSHLPHANGESSNLASSGSESDGATPTKRKIDAMGKSESENSTWKATEALQGSKSDLGPTTLCQIQSYWSSSLTGCKRHVWGFLRTCRSRGDYHDIIKNPMDFGTVRKKLSSGAYKDLEQFEKDVFLISSNAMRYNAPDTVYFRQARSIQELARKSFENLRQESDDGEPEPKVVRRGRPPGTGKNSIKRPVGRPPADRGGFEFSSEAFLANGVNGNLSVNSKNDFLRKGSGLSRQGADALARDTHYLHSSEPYALSCEQKADRNEDFLASALKGSTKYGKKLSVVDENRRNTYKQYQVPSSMAHLPLHTPVDGTRKVLVPVGLHMEYAYARSLARFAANLGPIGWKIAAQRIEKVLPRGTKFGPGWVGESDALHPSVHSLFSEPSFPPSSLLSSVTAAQSGGECSERKELPFQNS